MDSFLFLYNFCKISSPYPKGNIIFLSRKRNSSSLTSPGSTLRWQPLLAVKRGFF